jgi:hypothetical protein
VSLPRANRGWDERHPHDFHFAIDPHALKSNGFRRNDIVRSGRDWVQQQKNCDRFSLTPPAG